MERIQTKFKGVLIAMIIMVFLLPTQIVNAKQDSKVAELDMQIIRNENEDYIIYIKDLLKENFKYAILNKNNAEELEINYNDSEQDENGNYIVKISKEDSANKYLYVKQIKENNETKIEEVDYGAAFTIENLKEVEQTTRRIETELKTDIVEKDEEIDGLRTKVTVGGLKIKGNESSKYFYSITKLPAKDYDRLKELANKINSDFSNTEIDICSKIQIAKEFNELYTTLSKIQDWKEVKDLVIMQPSDAQKDEEYIVYLKEVDENDNETLDIKIMKSYREDEEDKIPGRTETKVVKETTKLPITGDSIILFVILAIILLVAIIIFVRMKKLQKKDTTK